MAIIRAEHALLKAACDLLGLGYFTWDLHSGDPVLVGTKLPRARTTSRPSATHQLFMSRVHPDDREYVLRATEQGLASQEAFYYEFRILLDDNSVRYIQSRLGAASPSSGTVFGTNMDVTEARLARQALRLSEERLTKHAICYIWAISRGILSVTHKSGPTKPMKFWVSRLAVRSSATPLKRRLPGRQGTDTCTKPQGHRDRRRNGH